jgi:hypothetical protein
LTASQSKFFYEKVIFLPVPTCRSHFNFGSHFFSKDKPAFFAGTKNRFNEHRGTCTFSTFATSAAIPTAETFIEQSRPSIATSASAATEEEQSSHLKK